MERADSDGVVGGVGVAGIRGVGVVRKEGSVAEGSVTVAGSDTNGGNEKEGSVRVSRVRTVDDGSGVGSSCLGLFGKRASARGDMRKAELLC